MRQTAATRRGARRNASGSRSFRGAPRVKRIERRVFADYIREKIIYDVERDLAAVAWVCRPRDGQDLPAVLCCHGMGPGKDPLVGLFHGEECHEYHKLVAVRLAQRGYLTLTPERRGFGECAEIPYGPFQDRYRADLDDHYRKTRRTSLLALDIEDARRALDVLVTRTDVDAGRIGCMGVYDGAAVAAGVAAMDRRVRAVSLACFCGDAKLCRGIRPRPLLVQIAKADPGTVRAAVPVHAQRHEFDGVLQLDFTAMAEWMDRHLR